jgi:hypothetical protein
MGSVYSTARHTIIFLGPATDPECRCEWILYELADGRRGSFSQFTAVVEDHILVRPWFQRVWVLQELVLSTDPWIQIGSVRIRWRQFFSPILSDSPGLNWRENSRDQLRFMAKSRSRYIHNFKLSSLLEERLNMTAERHIGKHIIGSVCLFSRAFFRL